MIMKNPSDKYPIVYIEWDDAFSCHEWHDEEELFRSHWDDEGDQRVFQIGWLIKKDSKKYLVASQWNEENDKWGHIQLIPKTWCKITVLASPKKKR